jgi:hypothetical protein
MKKFRVMYRPSERANDASAVAQDVYADGWRVDSDSVLLYKREPDGETMVFDVPKARIVRITEV